MISHKATMCLTSADVAVSCCVAMAIIALKFQAKSLQLRLALMTRWI